MNNFPKGNDLIVKWAIKYSDGTPFPLENYAWELCYSAGRGINVVKDTAVISVSDNLLTWRFSGKDQAFYGKYSLTLRLYQQGKIVATVRKNNAFELSTTQYDGPCDIDLVSYCDNISLQDALLRGNRAMEVAQGAKDIAGSAVNTAGGAVTTANEAKKIASTANNTSTEAKTIASNAKTVADQAKVTADATAATATQKAEEVAQKEAQLEAALNNLSTDQSEALALSTKVNEHSEKLSEIGSGFGLPIVLSEAGSIPFPIKAGTKYHFFNNGTNNVNVSTRNTPTGTVIDTMQTIPAGGELIYVTTSDANYFRFSDAFNGGVISETMLSDLVDSLSASLLKLDGNTETAFGKSFNNPTYAEIEFPILKDETYVVISTGTESIVVSTKNTLGGSVIDGPFSVPAGSIVSFIATTDANYIRFSNTFSGYVFRTTELYNLLNTQIGQVDLKIGQVDLKIDNVEASLSHQINQKVAQKVGKNLFDKNSPLLKDNSYFSQNGTIVSNQYSVYWLISNPIDVSGHQGGKIICNKSFDNSSRYCCFEDADGNKTTVAASVNAYTIPADAVTAYILVYKQNGVVNLDEVQIEFGNASSEYEPYNPIGGYFSEETKEETIFPPSPQKDMHDTYTSINTQFIYDIFDAWVAKFPQYVTKTNLGKDASGTYDVNGYKIAFADNPLFKIMFICNQHGGSANGDFVMGAYIATQFISDICGYGHRHNDMLKWIRNNAEIYIIPAANPWGIDNKRRVNFNGVNLNRNWPTSGWVDEASGQGTDDYKGAAAGDQPELQYYLQFISDVQPDIIIDNHTLGGVDGQTDANSKVMYIGFNKDAINNGSGYNAFISSLKSIMAKEYGITPMAYGHTTDSTPDCRTWCSENNIWGGLIEMQWRDPIDGEKGFTSSIIEASYMLCLSIYQYYANVVM